jgi:hypothetical protein
VRTPPTDRLKVPTIQIALLFKARGRPPFPARTTVPNAH